MRTIAVGLFFCAALGAQTQDHAFEVIPTPAGTSGGATVGALQLDSTNGFSVKLSAPATLTANQIFTIPGADITGGGCWTTNGSGVTTVQGCSITPPASVTYSGSSTLFSLTNSGSGLAMSANTASATWMAFGNAGTVNNSSATGYVSANGYMYLQDPGNEGRGFSFVNDFWRTTVDAYPGGWDQYGGSNTIKLNSSMNLPSDSNCATVYGGGVTHCTYGQGKGNNSEIYLEYPCSALTGAFPKTCTGTAYPGYNIGVVMNYEANLQEIDTGINVGTYAGYIVTQPGLFNCYYTIYCSGSVATGYGLWVENLDNTQHNLNSANAAAIELDGADNFGRIRWNYLGAIGMNSTAPGGTCAMTNSCTGYLELGANVQVQTASGVPFYVGGVAGNAGLVAGSLTVGSVFQVDGSGDTSMNGTLSVGSTATFKPPLAPTPLS